MPKSRARIRGLICDLDGTLVDSRLDFAGMRAGIGVPEDVGILEYIDSLANPAARAEAHAVLDRFETEGAEQAFLYPGVAEFLEKIRAAEIPLAILTRNSRRNAELTLARLGIRADAVVAREDAPPKPDPEGVLRILGKWEMAAADAIFVGDFLYDLEAGRRAEVKTVLFAPDELPEYAGLANFVVKSFAELDAIVFGEGPHG